MHAACLPFLACHAANISLVCAVILHEFLLAVHKLLIDRRKRHIVKLVLLFITLSLCLAFGLLYALTLLDVLHWFPVLILKELVETDLEITKGAVLPERIGQFHPATLWNDLVTQVDFFETL